MQKQRGFTLMELLVVIGIIALLVGMLFPAIAAVQNNAKKQENNTLVRGVIQSMVQASDSRRGFYPGIDSPTTFSAIDWDDDGSTDAYGSDPAARYWILLNGNYTTGETLISPRDEKEPWANGEVTTDNYSFTMLKIASNTNQLATASLSDRYRREEWRNEQNGLAPVVTDRLIAGTPGDPNTYQSYHKGSSPGEWNGSVGHSDLSVEFADTSVRSTRIAGYNNADDDDIFTDAAPSGSTEGDKNAAMAYDGFENPVGAMN